MSKEYLVERLLGHFDAPEEKFQYYTDSLIGYDAEMVYSSMWPAMDTQIKNLIEKFTICNDIARADKLDVLVQQLKTFYGTEDDGRPNMHIRRFWRFIELLIQARNGMYFDKNMKSLEDIEGVSEAEFDEELDNLQNSTMQDQLQMQYERSQFLTLTNQAQTSSLEEEEVKEISMDTIEYKTSDSIENALLRLNEHDLEVYIEETEENLEKDLLSGIICILFMQSSKYFDINPDKSYSINEHMCNHLFTPVVEQLKLVAKVASQRLVFFGLIDNLRNETYESMDTRICMEAFVSCLDQISQRHHLKLIKLEEKVQKEYNNCNNIHELSHRISSIMISLTSIKTELSFLITFIQRKMKISCNTTSELLVEILFQQWQQQSLLNGCRFPCSIQLVSIFTLFLSVLEQYLTYIERSLYCGGAESIDLFPNVFSDCLSSRLHSACRNARLLLRDLVVNKTQSLYLSRPHQEDIFVQFCELWRKFCKDRMNDINNNNDNTVNDDVNKDNNNNNNNGENPEVFNRNKDKFVDRCLDKCYIHAKPKYIYILDNNQQKDNIMNISKELLELMYKSNCYHLAANTWFDIALFPIIKERDSNLNMDLYKLIANDCKLLYISMKSFFLMSNEALCTNICTDLLSFQTQSIVSGESDKVENITEILEHNIQHPEIIQSCSPLSQRLSVSINNDSFYVSFEPKDALRLVVTNENMIVYNRVFQFFIQLKTALLQLNIDSTRTSRRFSPLRHQCDILLHRCYSFLSTIIEYSQLQIDAAWHTLESELKGHFSIWRMTSAHDAFLHTIENHLLLTTQLSPGLTAIMQLCKDAQIIARTVKKLTKDTANNNMNMNKVSKEGVELQRQWDRNLGLLLLIISKMSSTGFYPHLQNLLSLINFNSFFKE